MNNEKIIAELTKEVNQLRAALNASDNLITSIDREMARYKMSQCMGAVDTSLWQVKTMGDSHSVSGGKQSSWSSNNYSVLYGNPQSSWSSNNHGDLDGNPQSSWSSNNHGDLDGNPQSSWSSNNHGDADGNPNRTVQHGEYDGANWAESGVKELCTYNPQKSQWYQCMCGKTKAMSPSERCTLCNSNAIIPISNPTDSWISPIDNGIVINPKGFTVFVNHSNGCIIYNRKGERVPYENVKYILDKLNSNDALKKVDPEQSMYILLNNLLNEDGTKLHIFGDPSEIGWFEHTSIYNCKGFRVYTNNAAGINKLKIYTRDGQLLNPSSVVKLNEYMDNHNIPKLPNAIYRVLNINFDEQGEFIPDAISYIDMAEWTDEYRHAINPKGFHIDIEYYLDDGGSKRYKHTIITTKDGRVVSGEIIFHINLYLSYLNVDVDQMELIYKLVNDLLDDSGNLIKKEIMYLPLTVPSTAPGCNDKGFIVYYQSIRLSHNNVNILVYTKDGVEVPFDVVKEALGDLIKGDSGFINPLEIYETINRMLDVRGNIISRDEHGRINKIDNSNIENFDLGLVNEKASDEGLSREELMKKYSISKEDVNWFKDNFSKNKQDTNSQSTKKNHMDISNMHPIYTSREDEYPLLQNSIFNTVCTADSVSQRYNLETNHSLIKFPLPGSVGFDVGCIESINLKINAYFEDLNKSYVCYSKELIRCNSDSNKFKEAEVNLLSHHPVIATAEITTDKEIVILLTEIEQSNIIGNHIPEVPNKSAALKRIRKIFREINPDVKLEALITFNYKR